MEDAEYIVFVRQHSGGIGSTRNLGPLPVQSDQVTHLRSGYTATILHRSGGLPAVISKKGMREWWVNGHRHRAGDLPASIAADGSLQWWVDNNLHRDGDRPAIVRANGAREWWVHFELINNKQSTDFRDDSLRRVFVAAIIFVAMANL